MDSLPASSSSFQVPVRKILSMDDLTSFRQSEAYNDYISFILQLNESVKGKKLTDEVEESQAVQNILTLLDTLILWCAEILPVDNEKSRYGNPAFRDFYDKVEQNASNLQQPIILNTAALPETTVYLIESFGNRTRIDYGTGHEANFMLWLLCLQKLGVLTTHDHPAIVLRIFARYILLMRRLQFSYWLEPAGSHGVWGLDDYHFLPFLFGSAQLIGHKYIRPKSIHDETTVNEFHKEYLYLSAIHFINSIKTASLQWHSPMLNDISGVKTWDKVNSGMIKMYKVEVLGKLPIMQHVYFGTLIKFEGGSEDAIREIEAQGKDTHDHVHIHAMGQEFPDCCGIQVPSAIAAATGRGLVPFD